MPLAKPQLWEIKCTTSYKPILSVKLNVTHLALTQECVFAWRPSLIQLQDDYRCDFLEFWMVWGTTVQRTQEEQREPSHNPLGYYSPKDTGRAERAFPQSSGELQSGGQRTTKGTRFTTVGRPNIDTLKNLRAYLKRWLMSSTASQSTSAANRGSL